MLGLCGDSSAADDMPSNRATAVQNLTSYRWVGNVCELQSVIEDAVVLEKGSVAEIDAETERRRRSRSLDTLGNVERNYILRALNETRWVIDGSEATRRFSRIPAGLFAHGEARNQ